ncbi:PerC family transcriptional regulator [Salmonella enterica]|uniref:PerC family transcriptional regulator n=1 Tax=Salmonella enterica subsp. salamae serovar 47:b:1,5 TaxID=1967619 RepID=A0A735HHV1_SALER|nr:PerC family transcriptional regulator [Salmonella enterica]ECE6501176.1 hypothetical protein [Salmonella enterica subsp. salamae]EKR1460115.1 PerC family transcriptional regulator [Salmonella enterica subsp. salamae serovar 47:b:1,5]EAW4167323.1 PerC family transcriptional regulator [Salmonella enterica]EAW4327833.1 PerC family transcriptional regulator [Salmonella enterica]
MNTTSAHRLTMKRPPVKTDDYGELHKAVTETQHRMGIA